MVSETSLLQKFIDWLAKSSDPADRIKRNVILLIIIAALSLLPITLSSSSARFWAPLVAVAILIAFLATFGAAASIKEKLALGDEIVIFSRKIRVSWLKNEQVTTAWRLLTRLGLLFPAVIFFLFWTLLFISAWAWDPSVCLADPAIACTGAFAGLEKSPTFGDFLYFAVNMAFANPVPDILATSRLTHTLVTLEVISGIALATLYAGAFFGFARKK